MKHFNSYNVNQTLAVNTSTVTPHSTSAADCSYIISTKET